MDHRYKKGNKRFAEHTLPENTKHPLVDYPSSEEEPEPPRPEPWRAPKESSDEETVPEESSDEETIPEEQTVPLPPRVEPEEESHTLRKPSA